MKDYRLLENRWDGCKQYFKKYVESNDIDVEIISIKTISQQLGLTREQMIWYAFLYSVTHNVFSAFAILYEFPDYSTINYDKFDRFWKSEKQNLEFTSDRRRVKSMDYPLACIKSYKSIMGKDQEETLNEYIVEDANQSYLNLMKFCSQFFYFGRYSIDLYLGKTTSLLGLNIDGELIDFRSAESIRNGMLYALKMDDYVTLHHKKPIRQLTSEDYRFLDSKLLQLTGELNKEMGKKYTIWDVGSTLCPYKKLFWGDRYVGYYIDRQLGELRRAEDKLKNIPFFPFWDIRKSKMNKEYLGELQGWDDIRKPLQKKFMETGQL
ncbi:MAG TPA: hypothetical protein PKY56_09935 [Candidatus Kapabacteria bacterium]|nr:hypothetical protein [Candidatus Kapabacteria bacterium]